ncbi:translation elongation factor EF-1 alpha [Perkinsus olseni]|uniref:Translation elongation factor EF-1 alpha n=1 Tax=Perkinsus olseni TaxID=32597 RepID=A0A7J6TFH1_PEROL|nr:translation elongation factor EF-1 alpha [Perkinsus olseni]
MTVDTVRGSPMNVAFMGDYKAGKSTAAGHLLALCGAKKEEKVMECQRRAERAGQADLRYAWILDRLKVEQEKRMTINTNLDYFQTHKCFSLTRSSCLVAFVSIGRRPDSGSTPGAAPRRTPAVGGTDPGSLFGFAEGIGYKLKYRYTLLDCPGHKDYLRNAILGASQADVCVLMVSAVWEEFEEGMSQLGETREHALVAYVSGVRRMIVAVNKMDDEEVNFSQARFEKICSAVIRHLHNLGFGDDRIEVIPISALTGYNLFNRGPVDPSAEVTMPWHSGPSLYESLDMLPSPHRREAQGPFRMPIADIHRISSGSSSDTSPTAAGRCPKTAVILAGEVTSGTVAVGDAVRVVPGGIEATVVSIQTGNGVSERKAAAGDNIGIKVEGVTSKEVRRGQVLSCIGDAAVGEYRRVAAHVVLVNFPGELRAGYSPVIDIGTASSTVQFKSLKKRMHRTTGEVLEEDPELLIQGDGARVELTMSKPMACCVFQPSRSILGKFTIRDRKTVIAVGTILQTYLK